MSISTSARGRPRHRARGGRGTGPRIPPVAHLATQSSTPALSGATTPAEPETRARFSDFAGLSQELLASLPFEFCTEVQAATLPTILAEHDLLAQAKTGTGKTLAFLIPSIQRLLSSPMPDKAHTSILVLSPTRELAQQIGVVAEGLLGTRGQGRYGVKCVVGGTNMDKDARDLRNQRADVLVATPGRLVDLIENAGIRPRFANLRTLVLDEADRLLDAGFRRELVKILEALPDPQASGRQTLLFSATIPKEVHTIASLALRPDHKFITTLTEADVNTHEHVVQESLVVPGADILPATLEVLRKEQEQSQARGGFKVMVFLPTARAAALFHDVFAALPISYAVWEIHSRMSQSKRTKATDEFRAAAVGVLFSSDVTARGIDVKGVTAVVQVGLPMNSEQYIHRLGRTARAGAEGHGILVLGDFESHFLRDKVISSLSLQPYPLNPASNLAHSRNLVETALAKVPNEAKEQAYQAWLGYYNSNLRTLKWTQADLVRNANDYARVALRYQGGEGEWQPPGLLAKTVGKMGLRGVPGLRIVKESLGQGQGQRQGQGQGHGQRHGQANPTGGGAALGLSVNGMGGTSSRGPARLEAPKTLSEPIPGGVSHGDGLVRANGFTRGGGRGSSRGPGRGGGRGGRGGGAGSVRGGGEVRGLS